MLNFCHFSIDLSFFQDTILSLEALSRYSILGKQAVLDMAVNIEYRNKGDITSIKLTQQKPVAKPIEVIFNMWINDRFKYINTGFQTLFFFIKVTQNDDVILKTAMTSGVSFATVSEHLVIMSERSKSGKLCH